MVPWPHMPSVPTLLKKIVDAAEPGRSGGSSSAPTMVSEPRGSQATALRQRSCTRANAARRSARLPVPRSGAPDTTTRVGSPPVWESMTSIACMPAWSATPGARV